MSKTKPRRNKKYRGPTDTYNPIDVARNAAKTISPETQEKLVRPAIMGYHMLRTGGATRDDWNAVIDCLNAGEALAERLNICANLLPELHAGFKAMHAVGMRMMSGKGSTCYSQELRAIGEAINCYGMQIKLCSQSEYNKAVARVRGMLSNGRHVTIRAEYEMTNGDQA